MSVNSRLSQTDQTAIRSPEIPETLAAHCGAFLRLTSSLGLRDHDDLARSLARELQSFVRFDFLDLIVYESDGARTVKWRAIGAGQPLPAGEIPRDDSLSWWVYAHQEPLSVDDCASDPQFPELAREIEGVGNGMRSLCRLPLTTAQRRVGVLGIGSCRPRAFSLEEITFLSLAGGCIALSIESALNYEASLVAQSELQRQNARLEFLLDLTSKATSSLDLHELLQTVAACIRKVIPCNGAGIMLREPNSGQERIFALDFPDSRGFLREGLLLTPAGSGGAAIETATPAIESRSNGSAYDAAASRLIAGEGIKAQCVVPLVHRGRALGRLGLGRTQETPFSQDDVEFLAQIAGQIAIAIENALAWQEISELKDKLAQEKLYLEEQIRSELSFEQIIGKSAALRHVLELVETVAPNDSTVLLLGETGTGKELIARAIHDHSRRKERTFVKLNCAAIPTGLLESELFGHEKGAFTGAVSQKIGRLELADQGTLFLDEVGDIPIEIQPKLLRVLQEREFERLGSTYTRRVNVRLVAATNRDLEQMVASRQFRSDLYYRLNVFPIRIPPLRDRREDIPLLVRYFVQKYARQTQKQIESIATSALQAISALDWPGNVRELENFIERAVILTRGKALEMPLAELRQSSAHAVPIDRMLRDREEIARIVRETLSEINHKTSDAARNDYEERQRAEITRLLRETRGRVAGPKGAAARMGISRTTLLSRMKKLGISPKEFL